MNRTNEAEATNEAESKAYRRQVRGRRIVLAVVIITIVAVSLLRTIKPKYANPHIFKYGVHVSDSRTERVAQQSRQAYLDRAITIRNHWRIWALNHKDLLSAMLYASPGNDQPLQHLFSELPNPSQIGTKTIGVTFQDLNSGGIVYTWQIPFDHVRHIANADVALRKAKSDNWLKRRIQQNAKDYHDIELSDSESIGLSYIAVWVSGRITETTYLPQNIPGKPTLVEGKPKDLYPPYDFIERKR